MIRKPLHQLRGVRVPLFIRHVQRPLLDVFRNRQQSSKQVVSGGPILFQCHLIVFLILSAPTNKRTRDTEVFLPLPFFQSGAVTRTPNTRRHNVAR